VLWEPTTLRSSCPPTELDCCSTMFFWNMFITGENLISRTSQWFFNIQFSMSSVKSEFLFNLPSFWHNRLVWSPCAYFSVLADSYNQNGHYA
jgi:hypothetical protein